MEFARAGAGHDIYLTASTAPIFRLILTAKDFEFLDGIYAGIVQQAEVAAAIDVVGAVNGPIVLREAAAVDGEIVFVGSATGSLNTNVDGIAHRGRNTGHEGDHLFIVARAEGKFLDLRTVDQSGRGRRDRVHMQCIGLNVDDFVDITGLKRRVDSDLIGNV